MKGQFPFESSIKQLVLHLDSLISNVEHFSIDGSEQASQNVNNQQKINHILSCQIVNFGSESGSQNHYDVYNYCLDYKKYEAQLKKYFDDIDNNKSILSIWKKEKDNGIWYSERQKTKTNNLKEIKLGYNQPPPTQANYRVYVSEKECEVQWRNWTKLMFRIYKNANSVFSKNIKIKLTDKKHLYSGIYITFVCKLNLKQIGIIGRICETLLNDIAFKDLIPNLHESIEKQATKSAISQVMARNMSHNIGSHVMNKLIGDLRSLELLDFEKDKTSYKSSKLTKLHSKIEEKLKKDDWYNKADDKLKGRALKNEIALKLISDFNSYVKCRMDYLADQTFGTPAMLSSKNVYTDIFEDLDKVRLLLDNISGRGQQFQYKLLFKFKDNQLCKETDFPVAIPNDVLGCQAFYNIIENVIRNTAKHATNTSIPIKEFTINFREIGEEEIDGNIDLWHKVKSLYCVEIYDNLPIDNIEALVKSQNLKINGKILDEENKLRGESLGMIEMDASAAYLRQLEIVEVDSDDYDVDEDDKIYNSKGKLNILKAFNKNGCLAYRFFIKKPQEVLIVTNKKVDNKQLIKNGIWLTDIESFKQHLNQNRNYNHNFLVLEVGNSELKSLVAEREAGVTKRIYYKTADEIKELLQKTPEEIKLALWVSRASELYDIYKDALDKDEKGNPDIYNLPQLHNSFADFSNHLYKIADSPIPQDEWNKHCNNHFYYEGLSSKAQSVLPGFVKIVTNEQNEDNKISKYTSSLTDESNYQTKLKVGESILNRIIVLDERIQDKLNEKLFKIPYSEHFKMSGIFVPNKDFDLKADTIEIKGIEDFVDETMKKNNYGLPMKPEMDYLLIHYSLLERAYETEKEKNKSMELEKKEWVHYKLKDLSKKLNIVVTSGRGNIQGLPDNVRFVNLSVITTALIDIKSKYLIHNILHSSRTT